MDDSCPFDENCAERSKRFLPPSVAEKYDLDIPPYEGDDQIVETAQTGRRSKAEKVLKIAERQDM